MARPPETLDSSRCVGPGRHTAVRESAGVVDARTEVKTATSGGAHASTFLLRSSATHCWCCVCRGVPRPARSATHPSHSRSDRAQLRVLRKFRRFGHEARRLGVLRQPGLGPAECGCRSCGDEPRGREDRERRARAGDGPWGGGMLWKHGSREGSEGGCRAESRRRGGLLRRHGARHGDGREGGREANEPRDERRRLRIDGHGSRRSGLLRGYGEA